MSNTSGKFENITDISTALGDRIRNTRITAEVVQEILQGFGLQSMYLTEAQVTQIAQTVDAMLPDGDLGDEAPRAALGHLLALEIKSYAQLDRDALLDKARENFKNYLTSFYVGFLNIITNDVLDEGAFASAYTDGGSRRWPAAPAASPPDPATPPAAAAPAPAKPGDRLSGKAKQCFNLLATAFDKTGMSSDAIKGAKQAAELALIQAPNSSLYNLFHDNKDLLSIDEDTAKRIAVDWAKENQLAQSATHPLEKDNRLWPVNQFIIKKLIVEELLNRESKFPPIKGEEKSKADARAVLKEELKQYCKSHTVLNAKLFLRKQFNSRMLDELYDAIGKGDKALYDRALTQEYFIGIREIAEGLKNNIDLASANERVTKVLEGMKNQIGNNVTLSLTMRDLTEVADQVKERGEFARGLLGEHAADYTLSKMLIDRIGIEPEKQAEKLRGQMHQAVFNQLAGELQSLYNKNFRDADSLFTDRKLDPVKFQNLYAALGSESQEVFNTVLEGKTADGKEDTKTPVKPGAKVSAGVLAAVAGGGLVLGYLGDKQEQDTKHEAQMRGEQPKQGTNWLKWGGILLTLGAIGYGVFQYMNGKSKTGPQLAVK